LQQGQQSDTTDPVTAAAPAAPAPQQKDYSALPQLAQADMAKQAKVAEVTVPPAAAPAMSRATPPAMEVSKAKESKSIDDARLASAAKPRNELKRADQQAESVPTPVPTPPVMVAAAPEPTKVTITGSAIRRQEMSSVSPTQVIASSASAEEKAAAENQYANNAKMRAPAVNAAPAKTEAAGRLAKAYETESRSPATTAEKPLLATPRSAAAADAIGNLKAEAALADKKADMVAAAPSPPAQAAPRAVMPVPPVAAAPPVMSVPPLAAPPARSLALAPETNLSAPDWLQKIGQLLKAQHNKEALEEWKKFRQVYPDFAVDKSLQKQIDGLQK
jgi:hypothetical protein